MRSLWMIPLSSVVDCLDGVVMEMVLDEHNTAAC